MSVRMLVGIAVVGSAAMLTVPVVAAVGLSGFGATPLATSASAVGAAVGADGGAPGAAGTAAPAGPSPAAVPGASARYLAAFGAAAQRFAVPWSVLAAIYKVECDFGRSPLPGCPRGTQNAAGAQGPGQFLPGTWRRGLAAHQIIPTGPPTSSDRDGYATDGDGDGTADPWDPADAVASTARLLAADGAASDLAGAILSYNHDPAYVAEVMALAARYGGPGSVGTSSGPAPGVAPVGLAAVIRFALSQLGKPYRWGGAGPATWDCSGLTMAAYATAGVRLTHDAAAQWTETSAHPVALGALHIGDLVFYGTSPPTIHHVGIYVGGGQMIDAPFTGADVRVDPIAARDLLGATRPLGG